MENSEWNVYFVNISWKQNIYYDYYSIFKIDTKLIRSGLTINCHYCHYQLQANKYSCLIKWNITSLLSSPCYCFAVLKYLFRSNIVPSCNLFFCIKVIVITPPILAITRKYKTCLEILWHSLQYFLKKYFLGTKCTTIYVIVRK